MKKYARIVDGVALEIFVPPEGFDLYECFPKDTADLFTEVPGFVIAGATVDADGNWANPPDPEPQPDPDPPAPVISHGEFRALFTLKERTAIRKDSAVDEGVAECYAFMNDSPPPQVDLGSISTIEILDYLVEYGILAESRKSEILTGNPR